MSQRRQHREGGVSESGPEYDLQAQVWGEEVGEVPTQSPGTTALSDVPVSFFSSGPEMTNELLIPALWPSWLVVHVSKTSLYERRFENAFSALLS